MEQKGINYRFSAIPWQHKGVGGWHFVSLPVDMAKEIRTNLRSEEQGWGRLQATALIGNTAWKTAIWFDTKRNTYLLPLKAEVRRAEAIRAGSMITANICL